MVRVNAVAFAGALLAGLRPTCAQSLGLAHCVVADVTEQWTLSIGSATSINALGTSSCLSVNSTSPEQNYDVSIQQCDGSQLQLWIYKEVTGFLSPYSAPNLCITLAAVFGPGINLWTCSLAENNTQWSYASSLLVTRQGGQAAFGCLKRGIEPGSIIPVNGSFTGRRFDGIGGLAAIGGARLLYEYPEPQRSDLLDLMFSPSTGAGYQLLKTEIEGDIDSSYGSGPSYQHTRDPASRSMNRGIYLPWLVQEAKKRNPSMVLYSLAWGVPAWIGNGTYYSQDGLDYHVNYLLGAQAVWNVTYDYTGVWNERPFERSWVKAFRAALDEAGLDHTQIVLNDLSDSGCLDCPTAWGDTVHAALANDLDLRAAVGVVGFHSADVEGLSPLPGLWEEYNMSFWQSESNIMDGAMPQWLPNPGNVYGSGLSWPRVFLANYIRGRATATVLCPIMHSFTWNYGRHNHGHSEVVEPWSGYYELGSGFWGQAHFGQFTAVGWHFIDGMGSNQICTSGALESCYLLWGTLVAPSEKDMSLIVVNTNASDVTLAWQFTGSLSYLAGSTLAVWRTIEDDYFLPQPDASVDAQGILNVTLSPRSVYTFTTLRTGSHTVRAIPPRAPFPLPYTSAFSAQKLEEPGRMWSDLYGAFYVLDSPDGVGQAVWQAVPADPSKNSWIGNGVPFTSLPAGTNYANSNITGKVWLSATDLDSAGQGMIYMCGRVPIWQPASFAGAYSIGVCLSLRGTSSSWTWELQDNVIHNSTVKASGTGTGPFVGVWHAISLAFADDSVTASLDGVPIANVINLRSSSGVVGLGTGWNTGYFNALSLDATTSHGRTNGSFLYDVLPGEVILSNITGWAGLALDLSPRPACTPRPDVPSQPITVAALGRFKTVGNERVHGMNIVRASDGASMLPGGPVSVNMSCTTDLLGFCYVVLPAPVLLHVGDTYYFVSEESTAEGSDSLREMTDAAKMTDHVHRDGSTYMSYAGPMFGCVAGRALQQAGQPWTLIPDLDTSYGPVNFIMG